MNAPSVLLLDEYGQPLSPRLQRALLPLAPRLRRQFPALTDDCTITEVLEEAGRRMAAREERKGPLDNLDAYAWVVAKRMAILRLRCSEWVIASATLTGAESEIVLRAMPSTLATSEQIFNDLLFKEVFGGLNPTELTIAMGRESGQSTDEIARGCGLSSRTVFNAWRRLKRKLLHQALGIRSRSRRPDWKKSPTT